VDHGRFGTPVRRELRAQHAGGLETTRRWGARASPFGRSRGEHDEQREREATETRAHQNALNRSSARRSSLSVTREASPGIRTESRARSGVFAKRTLRTTNVT